MDTRRFLIAMLMVVLAFITQRAAGERRFNRREWDKICWSWPYGSRNQDWTD